MKVECPSCNAEYDCEPGRYRCSCGAEFTVPADDDSASSTARHASAVRIDDPDVTISPRHTHAQSSQEVNDVTMPGRRERKPDGRFEVGDLILGRYKVLSELGQGGMGVVYKCFDETAGIIIALKALPPELARSELEMEDVKENFQLVSRLVHQNIANYKQLEKDSATGNYYLIMECVEGEDLRRWIKRMRRENALTLEKVLPVIRQVAAALDYAHKQKIIHRDIKPGNIMIDAEGNVKVLDFGLAAQIHTSMTRVSMVSQGTGGTAPYMAPEQWRGWGQDAAADQYALAVMTYEMLAGHLPFESPDMAVLQQAVLTQEPRPVEGLPEYAQAALLRGMAKVPGDRFGSCAEFAAALGGEGKAVAPVTPAVLKPERKAAPPAPPIPPVASVAPAPKPTPPPKPTPAPKPAPAAAKALIAGGGSEERNGKKLRFVIAAIIVLVVGFFVVRTLTNREGESAYVSTADSRGTSSERAETGRSASNQAGRTISLPGNVKLELVKVEAGTFEMSAEDGENDSNEVPHQVTLTKDFYIGRTEVTQAQWMAVMGANPSQFKGDDLPVEYVTWNDAMSFCEKLNATGKAPDRWMFTLPTETQWEYAAKGGKKSKGYKYSGSDKLGDVAWYDGNSDSKTHPVKQKTPNELGLYDMSGNVFEWCLDDWKEPSDRLTAEFTRGNNPYGSRVLRGGSWRGAHFFCRSTYRFDLDILWGGQDSCIGFRVALVPAEGYGTKSEATSPNVTQQKPSSGQTSTASGSMEQRVRIPAGDKTIDLSNGVKLELVKVEAGSFEMSAKDGENDSNEVPHRATLTKDFYIGRTEVTQAQWKAVMGNNPSKSKGDDLPVEQVTWNEAMAFCEILNSTGKAPSGWKFTLPTETQWEFAARGGNKSKGYKYSGSNKADDVAWYYENSGDSRLDDSSWNVNNLNSNHCKTHPVGQKKSNELGLYDMSGNVWEWCLDDWNRDSSRQKAEFTRGNDQGGLARVFRGGSWFIYARECRSAARNGLGRGDRINNLGFRLALVPVQ